MSYYIINGVVISTEEIDQEQAREALSANQ